MTTIRPSAPYWEYTERGELRWGPCASTALRNRWQFSAVTLSPKQIVLEGSTVPWAWMRRFFPPARYALPIEHILTVHGWPAVLPLAVRIEHDLPQHPIYFEFVPRHRERFLSELRAMGYPVT